MKPMRAATLAKAIERDTLAHINRRAEPSLSYNDCFTCGRSFHYRPSTTDDNGRFCSSRCRKAYDAGTAAHSLARNMYFLPMSGAGFLIKCAGCGRSFSSIGLRCCSVECARRYRQRCENAALLAEVGSSMPVKRKCQRCGGHILNWRNGRRVSKAIRFCSPRCSRQAKKAGMATDSPTAVFDTDSAKKSA